MSALGVSVVTAVVTAVLAVAGTYVTARRELQLKFDESLRGLRLEAYGELMGHLDGLAKYGRSTPLSTAEARAIRDRLKRWYFETGGLLLSTEARLDYFRLQDGLELASARRFAGEVSPQAVDEWVRVLSSRLRTAMTADVGTRRTFVFRTEGPRTRRPRPANATFEAGGATLGYVPVRGGLPFVRERSPFATHAGDVAIDAGGWDPSRQTQAATRRRADGTLDRRLLLVEPDAVVEGPAGWHPHDDALRLAPVLWRRVSP